MFPHTSGRDGHASHPPCQLLPIIGIVAVGLFLHGPYVSKLGLYWDDAYQFMQAMQAADGNALRFIFSDSSGAVDSERPVSYAAFVIARAAFAISLPALHWTLLALLVGDAIAVASVARRIVDDDLFAFAAGTTFLLYPLAPLQAIWPATVHHLVSFLLSFGAVLLALYGLALGQRNSLRYILLATVALLASTLTSEVFALVAPVLVIGGFVSMRPTVCGERTGLPDKRRIVWDGRLAACLASFFMAGAAYAIWRLVVLPRYGGLWYQNQASHFDTRVMVTRVLTDAKTALLPWSAALREVWLYWPEPIYVVLAAVVFVGTWRVAFSVLRRLSTVPTRDGQTERLSDLRWLRAATIGLMALLAGIAPLALVADRIGGIDRMSHAARANFAATIGIAILLPALVGLLGAVHQRLWHAMTRSRFSAAASLAFISLLIVAGFVHFPGKGTLLSHRSVSAELFGRFSFSYAMVLVTYGTILVLSALVALLSFATRFREGGRAPITFSSVPTHIFSATVSMFVLIAVLYHFSFQQRFVVEWSVEKRMLEQLHRTAPALADRTFVIIDDVRADRSVDAPYASHWDLSCYMLALYDNWSIMANTLWHIGFHRNGLDSTYYGRNTEWFPDGVKGLWWSHGQTPVPRISYDRVLLFKFDGRTLRLLPHMEVATDGGDRLLIDNHPERILAGKVVHTAIWKHVAEGP